MTTQDLHHAATQLDVAILDMVLNLHQMDAIAAVGSGSDLKPTLLGALADAFSLISPDLILLGGAYGEDGTINGDGVRMLTDVIAKQTMQTVLLIDFVIPVLGRKDVLSTIDVVCQEIVAAIGALAPHLQPETASRLRKAASDLSRLCEHYEASKAA